ncbi:GntR family transcriptional regulator [Oerskovia sp. M15]
MGIRSTGVSSPTTTEQIKEYILRAHLRPGDVLPTEAELCSFLGVSRSNVREAIRTLAALDIVEVRHGYGTFVGQLSLKPLVEGLVFRGVLIPGDDFSALREVVEVRQALDISMADQIVAEMAGSRNPELERLVGEMERKARAGRTSSRRTASSTPTCSLTSTTSWWLSWAPRSGTCTRSCPRSSACPPRADRPHREGARGDAARGRGGDAEAYRDAVVAHYAPSVMRSRRWPRRSRRVASPRRPPRRPRAKGVRGGVS